MEGKRGRGLILAAAGIAVLYWISQALMDAVISTEGDFVQQLWSPEAHEFWMRLLVVCAITLIGVYAQQVIDERWQAGKKLEHLTLVLRAVGNVNQLITKEKDRDRLLKGVCDSLTETRVYHNAWIALLDESAGLIATAESGLGEEFLPMLERLRCGELPDCVRRVMEKPGVMVVKDSSSICTSDSLAPMYEGRGGMAVRLEYNGQTYGLLVVSTPKDSALDEEERALLEEVARNIAFTLYNIELEEERQLTEEALRQSEAKNRALLNAVPDVMYRINRYGTFLEFKAAKGAASYAPPIEFIGRRIDEMLPAEVAKATTHSVEQVLQTGEVQIFEYQLPIGDDMHSYEARATASGQDEVLLMVRDITKRKQAEEAVRESEQKFRELADLLPQTIFELDMLGNFTFANRQAFESSGYTPEDIARGLNALQLFIPEDRDRVGENMKRRLSGEEFGATEYTELRKDGSTFPVLVYSVPVIREDKSVGLRGIIIDITERKQAEEAVQKHAHDLGKRVKELDCLYGASRLMAELDRPADKVFREVVGFIPRSWQYPDIACARITFRGQQFKTDNFKETAWRQSADVMVFGEKAGSVEVRYLREKPNVDEGPFLKEERGLIDALAREIGKFIEHQRMEEEIRKHRDHLEEVVAERTAELAKTNEELQVEVTERKRVEKKIQQQNEFLSSVLDSLTHPFYVIDANDYTVKLANQAAKMGDLSENLTCHRIIYNSHKPCRGADHVCPLNEVKKTKKPAVVEHIHSDKDGNTRNVEIHGYPIFDSEGNVIQMIEYCLDITERKQMEEEQKELVVAYQEQNQILASFQAELEGALVKTKQAEEAQREARKAAEAANQAKGEFLARMSHEVRTPIHGIMGMLELVQETKLSRDQRDYLDIANTSAESLLNIINSILDFSKIGAGKLEREDIEFDLRAVLEHTVEAQVLVAHRKGLELSCHLPPEIPSALVGDVGHLRQVLLNLIHNAVKFTKQGEVVVRVAMAAERKQEVKLHFAVHDTGIGIPEDKLKLIFEAFHQADGSASRQYDGTGLGLAISKQLVELMGGRLQAESHIGEGSVFHFTLKFKKQAYARIPMVPPEAMVSGVQPADGCS